MSRLAGRRMVIAALALGLVAGACASKQYVRKQIQSVDRDLRATAEGGLAASTATLAAQRTQLEEAAALAALAHERSVEAARRAREPLPLTPAYTVEGIGFAPGSARLSRQAMSILDQLATRLRLEDRAVHLEIRGHADGSGDAQRNLRLGRIRAEAVLRHLHTTAGVPLHAMRVISLGDTAPIADDTTPAGRARNRRVDIVVLRRGA